MIPVAKVNKHLRRVSLPTKDPRLNYFRLLSSLPLKSYLRQLRHPLLHRWHLLLLLTYPFLFPLRLRHRSPNFNHHLQLRRRLCMLLLLSPQH